MFDNLLYQNAGDLLQDDIINDRLPGALLLSGPVSSGKLTCALELSRILSCHAPADVKGEWTCTCPSCLQHKALVNTNVLLAGPRDCSLEIAAAKHTFLEAAVNRSKYVNAARYLFVRSIRKLTMRFSQILWQDDDKLSKIAPLTAAIDECLEEIDPPREIPEYDTLVKICDETEKQCLKLETGFMYDSIPVLQIRNASAWAHLAANEGRKVIIIENADRMLDSVRNALLKILEEPPADTVFVLTTSHRGAVMPTILSRVRTYSFVLRTADKQKEVLSRVFHDNTGMDSIDSYLLNFLPVKPDTVRTCADNFFKIIAEGGLPDVQDIMKACSGFDPRILFRIFLEDIETSHRELLNTAQGTDAAACCSEAVHTCWTDVSIYNQSPAAALEMLIRSLSKINIEHGRIFGGR